MKKTKNGITLIALIITIIVMLILVGVTVSVAINGELFKTAKEAAYKTQIEQERETLNMAVVAAYDVETGTIKKETLQKELTDWTVEGDALFNCTSPKGNKYTISNTGEIKLGTELEQYILGDELKGKNLDEIYSFDTKKFIDNDKVKFMYFLSDNENAMLAFMYIKYNNEAIYRFKIKFDTETDDTITVASEGVKEIYKPKGNEGELLYDVTGKDEHKDWTILYDNGDTVEAVYNYAIGEVGLGAEYETTDFTTNEIARTEADLDRDGTISNLEKAIYSYNHSIETINNYCNTLTGLPTNTNVRSVGAKKDTTKEYYTFEDVKIDETNKTTIKARKPDMEYESDAARLMFYDIAKTTTKGSTEESPYLFASRRTYNLEMEADGTIFRMCGFIQPYYYENELWRSGENGLFYIYSNEGELQSIMVDSWNMPVRPIITVEIK